MKDAIIKMWDDRYKNNEFSYGKNPNDFFKHEIQKLEKAKVLFGGEGEGRNAVYAAKLGWDVSAFDISIEGKKKAEKWANENNVNINYKVGLLPTLDFQDHFYDAIVLIFAHFPPQLRSSYHQILSEKLKPGGHIILEAFSKTHLEYQKKNSLAGGPKNLEALMSKENIMTDFHNYQTLELTEKEIQLNEGIYHNGTGHVVRFVGKKL